MKIKENRWRDFESPQSQPATFSTSKAGNLFVWLEIQEQRRQAEIDRVIAEFQAQAEQRRLEQEVELEKLLKRDDRFSFFIPNKEIKEPFPIFKKRKDNNIKLSKPIRDAELLYEALLARLRAGRN